MIVQLIHTFRFVNLGHVENICYLVISFPSLSLCWKVLYKQQADSCSEIHPSNNRYWSWTIHREPHSGYCRILRSNPESWQFCKVISVQVEHWMWQGWTSRSLLRCSAMSQIKVKPGQIRSAELMACGWRKLINIHLSEVVKSKVIITCFDGRFCNSFWSGNRTGAGLITVVCTTDGFYPDIFGEFSSWCSQVSHT